jgi:hypothetical protein
VGQAEEEEVLGAEIRLMLVVVAGKAVAAAGLLQFTQIPLQQAL